MLVLLVRPFSIFIRLFSFSRRYGALCIVVQSLDALLDVIDPAALLIVKQESMLELCRAGVLIVSAHDSLRAGLQRVRGEPLLLSRWPYSVLLVFRHPLADVLAQAPTPSLSAAL